MATNLFKVFDENNTNIQTDAQYLTDTDRTNGVASGQARSILHNKLYRQVSSMAYAIGQFVTGKGYDANDTDYGVLATNVASAINYEIYNDRSLVKDPTGFTNNSTIGCAYDSTNRTITLTGTFEGYYRGVKVAVLTNGWVSSAHSTTLDQTYYLRYNGTSFLFDTTPWDYSDLQIAVVQYGTLNKIAIKETHGFMPWDTHLEFHNTIGAYKSAGGTLTAGSWSAGSTTATDRRPLVDATTFYDEDLKNVINALSTETYTQKYLVGAGATRTLVLGAGDILPVTGATPYYNQNNGGTWQQTAMSNNQYAAVWLTAIPVTSDAGSQAYRYIWTQPQTVSTNLATIRALTPSDIYIGDPTALVQEFAFIVKIIIRMASNNWTITEVQNLTGNRFNQTGSPQGAYLTIVNTDVTLTGDGTTLNPLIVATPLTAQNVGTLINSATDKTPPVDADYLPLMDSATGNIMAKLSWANLKATIKSYYDAVDSTLTNKSLSDSTTNFVDVTDATKKLNIDVTGTTGITGVLQSTFTTAKTLILPDIADTIVTKTSTDTLTNKTLTTPKITSILTPTNTLTLPTTADTVVARATTDTLTNKRVTKRVNTEASSATSTPTGDSSDMWTITALAAADTIAAPTGTPTNGQELMIRILDNGTARALTWNAIYRGIGATLPATTVISKTMYCLFMYNSAATKWDCLEVDLEGDDSVTLSQVQTLTNKTLTTPKINEAVALTATSTYLNRVDATSSIQTQLNGKLANIVEDTTPQLGGELDCQAFTIGFTEYDNGNSGTSLAIDWRKSNHQKVTMTGNCTFTFTAPTKPCMLSLRIINDATAGRTIALPTIKKVGGTAFTWTSTANAIDLLSLYFDGTNYYGQNSLAWA